MTAHVEQPADIAKDAVFVKSAPISKAEHSVVRGPDLVSLFEQASSRGLFAASADEAGESQRQQQLDRARADAVLACVRSLGTIGFQATNLARAAQELLHMIHGRKRSHVIKAQVESRTGYDDITEGQPKERAGDFFWRVDPALFDEKIRKPAAVKASEQDGATASAAAAAGDAPQLTYFGLPEHCTVYVGAVSNIFLSSVRESLAMMARHRFLDVLVVSGGGFEFDLQRALDPDSVRVVGFDAGSKQAASASSAPARTYGNVLVSRSAKLDAFLAAVIPRILYEGAGRARDDVEEDRDMDEDCPHRRQSGVVPLSPHQFWTRLARLIPDDAPGRETSVLWQCVQSHISVFSPSLVDGPVWEFLKPYARHVAADMVSDPQQQQQPQLPRPRLVIDLVRDIGKINKTAVKAKSSGMIVLGGGVVKHHVCNANLMRNGADFSVFINSAQEFDGSDAGARPDEAVSWGKIRQGASSVKVYSEIAAVFPLLATMTFGEVLAREQKA